MKTAPELTDPAAIAANQRGELTDAQRERARRAAYGPQGCWLTLLQQGRIPALGGIFLAALILLRAPAPIIWLVMLVTLIVSTELLLLTLPPFFQQRQLLRRDLVEERIVTAPGRLVYRRYGYEAIANDQPLLLPTTSVALRPEVIYRFYFFPRSGYVLSAEALTPSSPEELRATLHTILALLFDFDQHTLAVNRNGHLTPAQRVRLLPYLVRFANGYKPFAVFQDLLAGEVAAIEGVGHKIMRSTPWPTFLYRIGERHFQVSARAFEAFVEGGAYRAYFTPRSSILVSIELLVAPPVRTHHQEGHP